MFAVHEFQVVSRDIFWSEVNRRKLHEHDRLLMENGLDQDDDRAYQYLFDSPPLRFYDEPTMFGVENARDLPSSSIRDLTQSLGYRMRYAATLNRNGPWLDGFYCQTRSETEGRTLLHDERIGVLLPLMAGVIELGRVFTTLRARYAAALTALDALGLAVFLVDDRGRLLEQNLEAQDILDQHDGLALDRSGRLRARKAEDSAALTAAFEQVDDLTVSTPDASRIVVERPSARRSYLVSVQPLVDQAGELQTNLRCSFVTVIDPERSHRISVDGLRDLGGLTRAEIDVARLWIAGNDPTEICEIRNVSQNTLKTQMRIISQKLRCHGQADLVRLAVATSLPIRSDYD
ncbi:helix-turn-helix transcriptional regulator [Pseudoroseicyclus sp. H15]